MQKTLRRNRDLDLHLRTLKMHSDNMNPELDPNTKNLAEDVVEDIGDLDKTANLYMRNINKNLTTKDVIQYNNMILR